MKKIKKSVGGKGEINRNSVINIRNAKAITTFKNNWQILEKNSVCFSREANRVDPLHLGPEGKTMSTQKLHMNMYVSLADAVRLAAAKLPIRWEIL